MEKIISKVENAGWFGGELKAEIKIRRRFEGYHGRASETWETEYEFSSTEIKSNNGTIIFPSLCIKSGRFEKFTNFIKRVEERI